MYFFRNRKLVLEKKTLNHPPAESNTLLVLQESSSVSLTQSGGVGEVGCQITSLLLEFL